MAISSKYKKPRHPGSICTSILGTAMTWMRPRGMAVPTHRRLNRGASATALAAPALDA
jgi:hypothetical protein